MRNAVGSITRMKSHEPRVNETRTLCATQGASASRRAGRGQTASPLNPVAFAAEHERAIGLDRRDRESPAASDRDLIADGQLLKLGEDAIRARTIEIAEPPVEPVVAV